MAQDSPGFTPLACVVSSAAAVNRIHFPRKGKEKEEEGDA